jgi:acid phosphatase family membrane protein YuiD
MSDLLKESIADAKAVRETALANANFLEENFAASMKEMFAEKLKEEMAEEAKESLYGLEEEGFILDRLFQLEH